MNGLKIPHLPWTAVKSCVINADDDCIFAATSGQVNRGDEQEDFDTASLMAAAPDLYEALADLVAAFDGEPGFGPAKAALKKARGES